MGKFNYLNSLIWQKLSNLLENMVIPLVYFKRNKDIKVIKNLKYSDVKSRKAVCDFYYKETDKNIKKPIFIYIHGGGWISGTKNLRKYYCYPYADEGYFVMNMNYELAPQHKYPYQFQQIFNAIEFLLDNAEKYNLDTDKIFIAGESAGAYFTSFVGAIAKNHSLYDLYNIKFKYKDTFDVSGLLLINGAYSFKNLADIKFFNMKTFIEAYTGMNYKDVIKTENAEKIYSMSPDNFIGPNFPPCCIGFGEHDGLFKESQSFYDLLNKKKIRNTSFTSTGVAGIHGFVIAVKTKEGSRCLKIAQNFFKDIINEKDKIDIKESKKEIIDLKSDNVDKKIEEKILTTAKN